MGPSAETKTCRRCDTNLPVMDFYLLRGSKDGLDRYCRACRLQSQKDARAKKPDVYRATAQRRAARNREKYAEVYRQRQAERSLVRKPTQQELKMQAQQAQAEELDRKMRALWEGSGMDYDAHLAEKREKEYRATGWLAEAEREMDEAYARYMESQP